MKLVALMMAFTLAFTGCTFADGLKEINALTYSDHEPLGNMRTRFLNNVFFPAVESESHGRVKITPNWNAKISTGYDALKALRSGSADMAAVVPEYCMKDLRLHQLFKSFPAGPSWNEQVEFFRRVYDDVPALTDELDACGIHAAFIATGYPAGFFSAKPLARIQNIDSGYDIKAHKPAPCILTSPKLWLGHEYIIAVRKSLWDNLSGDDRQAFTRAAEKSYALLGAVMEDSFARQIEALRADGAEVRLMNDDEVSYWERAADYRSVQEKWIGGQDIDGLAEVLEEIRRCLAK